MVWLVIGDEAVTSEEGPQKDSEEWRWVQSDGNYPQ